MRSPLPMRPPDAAARCRKQSTALPKSGVSPRREGGSQKSGKKKSLVAAGQRARPSAVNPASPGSALPKPPLVVKAKKKPNLREKMKDGQELRSERCLWKVTNLLGSGGFGDVYKVSKKGDSDTKEYAMKTELTTGDKRLLRLKIESCWEAPPARRRFFVEFVVKGITDKFKFIVMGLVGSSLEDIRRQHLMRNYSKPTAMYATIQTFKAVADLHQLGWLHRDIKPQNYAVGLGAKESAVYILDFGIARKIFKGNSREVKAPRKKVQFLGTMRFCSRACHRLQEQGRKEDLETWLYMAFDLIDEVNGIPWKGAVDRREVLNLKDGFFQHLYPQCYNVVPQEFKVILGYVHGLSYHSTPDYGYIENALLALCVDNDIAWGRRPEWCGMLEKKGLDGEEEDETSADNKQSGFEDDEEEEGTKRSNKSQKKKQKSSARSARQQKKKSKK